MAQQRDPWFDIELRHLAALSAISREGTFSDAALSLGYVQSAVSSQLATLERLTGTTLVHRASRPGARKLTPSGELLLAHADEILHELRAARAELAAIGERHHTGVRVGVDAAVPDHLASRLSISASSGRFGGAGIVAIEACAADAVAESLVRGDADIAVTRLPLEHEEIATAEVTRDAPVLVKPRRALVDAANVQRDPKGSSAFSLIAWREGGDPSQIERELDPAALEATVVGRADHSAVVIELVELGVGSTVLPRCAIPPTARVDIEPLGAPIPSRVYGVAWLRSRSGERGIRRFVARACALRERADGDRGS